MHFGTPYNKVLNFTHSLLTKIPADFYTYFLKLIYLTGVIYVEN